MEIMYRYPQPPFHNGSPAPMGGRCSSGAGACGPFRTGGRGHYGVAPAAAVAAARRQGLPVVKDGRNDGVDGVDGLVDG